MCVVYSCGHHGHASSFESVAGNCTTVALDFVDEVFCGLMLTSVVFAVFAEGSFPLSCLFGFLILLLFFFVVLEPSLLSWVEEDRLLLLAATIFEIPSRKKYEPIPTAMK